MATAEAAMVMVAAAMATAAVGWTAARKHRTTTRAAGRSCSPCHSSSQRARAPCRGVLLARRTPPLRSRRKLGHLYLL
eukprot:1093434-Prymnesium_polylepis.1